MKKIVIISVLFSLSIIIEAQEVLDSIQIERIAKTSQLWGHIKYFHPYLEKNSDKWDQAYVNAIEDVSNAKSKKEFKNAINKMLLSLNDPITHIIESSSGYNSNDTSKYPIVSWLKDSVLLFSIKDYSDLDDFNYSSKQFSSLKDKLPMLHGVIFDLRGYNKLSDDLKGYIDYYFADIQSFLSGKKLNVPGYKARFHDGFKPENGSTSGGYSSGYYVKDDDIIYPDSKNSTQKIVFLINQFSELPRIALSLQNNGQGFILTLDSLSDASFVHSAIFELEDSLSVQIRLDELDVDKKPTADNLLPIGIEENEIFEVAFHYFGGNTNARSRIVTEVNDAVIRSVEITSIDSGNIYYPDFGNRMLAIAKIWTVVDYFYAYKDLMVDNWDEVLKEYIPRFAYARDSLEYNLAVAEMYTHIQDGHGFISSKVLSGYFGTASPPVIIRFIEEQPVIVDLLPDSVYRVEGIEKGDIITKINGEDVESVIERRMKYLSASNHSALYNYISWNLLNGNDSSTLSLTVRDKKNKIKTIQLPRLNSYRNYIRQLSYGGRDLMPITKHINNDIGYADLDKLTVDMVDKMFKDFEDTKAIIFDMRGYPQGTAWSIAPHLTDKRNVYAANFRRFSPMKMKIGEDISENLTIFNQSIPDAKPPLYKGITVMLIDERTQSQAEHTGLFFKAANQTKFIGSQTAGANGDVTNFQIPGNITLYFSGHDVRYYDGRQLQKIGLVPDIQIKPTIKGIRNGKDEVLEKAIEYVNSIIND
ncbi:MAG: hypothetical protein IPH20_22175 [Bacteroidales bacterium]|nr:hypothetical protein [Bacteroidales bacterium]